MSCFPVRAFMAFIDLFLKRLLTHDGASGVEEVEQRALGDVCPEALGESFGDVFLDRIIEDVLGLDELAGDGIDGAEIIGQAQLHALRTRPDQARERFRGFPQAVSPALAHGADELFVDLPEKRLGVLFLLGVPGRIRIEESALVQ